MAKKITIQHWYTTGSTSAPTGLIEGEVAISHTLGSEAIFLKNDKNDNEVKFIPKTQIDKLISAATTGLSTNLSNHIAVSGNTSSIGHVSLVEGDLQNITEYKVGQAASSYHTHGQYLEKNSLKTDKGFQITPGLNGAPSSYGVKAGTGITVDGNGVSIDTVLKDKWDVAANRINTFLDVQSGATDALDSLYEIQEYLTGSGNSVNTLLESLNELTDTVSGNTEDINTLKSNQFNYVQDVDEGDDYIIVNPGAGGSTNKTLLISHNTAQAESSAITATNDTTGLSFGSEFNILNKVAYDAKGHVVSGDTQTLKLPKLPTASTDNANISGVVKLKTGIFNQAEELLNNNKDYLTTAASIAHGHTEYVKLTALSPQNTSTGDTIIISCGTY